MENRQAEPVLQHTIRSWAENTKPVYDEVERIVSASREMFPADRVREMVCIGVRSMITDVLYGPGAASRLRNLYRRTHGERTRNLPDPVLVDKFRDSFTRDNFDALDWTTLVHDLTEGMYNA